MGPHNTMEFGHHGSDVLNLLACKYDLDELTCDYLSEFNRVSKCYRSDPYIALFIPVLQALEGVLDQLQKSFELPFVKPIAKPVDKIKPEQ